jgi:hypothetical protein
MHSLLRIAVIQWKEGLRSPSWHRKILVNVLIVLSFLYLAGNFLFLGFFLDDLLMHLDIENIRYSTHGPAWVLQILNRYLLYYFFAEFIIRYMMQKLPVMSIQPLLHLPLKRSILAHFMLGSSLFNPFLLAQILLFGPFVYEVFANLELSEALGWAVGFASIGLAQHFLLTYLKRSAQADARVLLIMIAALVSVAALHWYEVVGFTALSSGFFNLFFLQPWFALVPLVALFLLYLLNHNALCSGMYMSRLSRFKEEEITYTGTGILSRFGIAGLLCELDLKLIWRNKRPKSVLLMTALFLAYGLLIFPQPQLQDLVFMKVLVSILMTGMFIMNYGQFLLSWEGGFFDHILTRNVRYRDYYKGKLMLFALVTLVCLILCIPYLYFGWEVLLIVFATALFNLGINSFAVMFLSSINPKKINLEQKTVMNWQGVGASQFLLVLPVMGLPMLIVGMGSWVFGSTESIVLLGAIGLLGLAGAPIWLRLLENWLRNNRHEIAEDFRNE